MLLVAILWKASPILIFLDREERFIPRHEQNPQTTTHMCDNFHGLSLLEYLLECPEDVIQRFNVSILLGMEDLLMRYDDSCNMTSIDYLGMQRFAKLAWKMLI